MKTNEDDWRGLKVFGYVDRWMITNELIVWTGNDECYRMVITRKAKSPFMLAHVHSEPSILLHLRSCSLIFIHLHLTLFIFSHVHSASFIFIHLHSCSLIFTQLHSPSCIIAHLHSSSLTRIHLHSCSLIMRYGSLWGPWPRRSWDHLWNKSIKTNDQQKSGYGNESTLQICTRVGGRKVPKFGLGTPQWWAHRFNGLEAEIWPETLGSRKRNSLRLFNIKKLFRRFTTPDRLGLKKIQWNVPFFTPQTGVVVFCPLSSRTPHLLKKYRF